MDDVGSWSQAGAACRTAHAGSWWASAPEHERPSEGPAAADFRAKWQEPWGDRRQELVLIGVDLDEADLRARFDACLLTPDELALGPGAWSQLPDPFEPWGADEAPRPDP